MENQSNKAAAKGSFKSVAKTRGSGKTVKVSSQKTAAKGYTAYDFKTDAAFRRFARGDESEREHFLSELKKDIEERLAGTD